MREKGRKIAIYSRKSRFTGKGESIGNQIELCREYVRNMFGPEYLDRITVYEDEGFSGGDLRRPDFQKMMEAVRKRSFRAIIVYRLDRISRNISDFAGLIDELTKLDVSFVSIREQFDTGTPMGRAMMFIISVFSQLERETIAERIRDNMHELAKTGRWLGGNTPTGYASESVSNVTVDGRTRKACRLILVPEEAALVRRIFDLYTQTDSLTAVEAELLRCRAKTKRGNDFTRFAIKGILQNPVYMIADEDAKAYLESRGVFIYADLAAFDGAHGMMVYNRTDQEKGKTSICLPMTEWIVSVGKHPGLIPAKQWIDVQRSLEQNKSKAYRKPRTNEALLTGLLFCTCGGRMYPKMTGRPAGDGAPGFSYICKMKARSKGARCQCPNARGNDLDAAVLSALGVLSGDGQQLENRLAKGCKRLMQDPQPGQEQLGELRRELAEGEKKIDGLIDAMGAIEQKEARDRVGQRITQIMETNRRIVERIRELETPREEPELSNEMFAGLCGKLTDFRRTLDGMHLEQRRRAVGALVSRVWWDGTGARVVLTGAEYGMPLCEDSK